MRIGILGGTFDPIHNAHLIIAEQARKEIRLDKVLFIPAGDPWLRKDSNITPKELRLEMTRLAVERKPEFSVSSIETERPGPTYTVETVVALLAEWTLGVEPTLILGVDAVLALHRWKEPEKLLELCDLAVVLRPGYKECSLEEIKRIFSSLEKKMTVIGGSGTRISGTDIRDRIKKGQSIKGLVPEAVARFIEDKRLYLIPSINLENQDIESDSEQQEGKTI
ncbi:MAG: nicotinate-nucleotide adenylyltransferase [Chloroflexi bacterium]|jgi:nicotinate-nucleotide adenylyltransferase|nr:MAG: nicotinate-nucleotide adenylyltransferase [Chloroflexota bacterium]